MASTPASMLRIVTTGLQDRERLNTYVGQPSTKFYTAIHHRRTRWASQWRRVDFDNLADFGKRATVTLPVHAELITRITLVVTLPDLYTPQRQAELAAGGAFGLRQLIGPHWSWTNGIGHALCSDVELRIGDQVVDRLDSRLLEVIDEQEGPVDHWDSKNILIGRDPSAYTQFAYEGFTPWQQRQQTVEITFPFWFNRGPGPQALPIQALARDRVQISVNFRALQDCVYTDARVDPRNPGFGAVGVPGTLPAIADCGFYRTDSAGVPIYNMNRVPIGVPGSLEPKGSILPGHTMPPATSLRFQDAFWVVEYVSLEDREAAALRSADLQIPIEQHVAVPVTNTNGAPRARIPLAQGGLVRDMTWVAQRVEATDYNAYFLFSRDLADPAINVDTSGSFVPWWPNARLPDWDYGDGYIRPGFADRRSDPVTAATLWIRGKRRFELEGPSFFRSLIPALGCRRCPLIDRYIYRYDFGFWPTGGLEEALHLPQDQVRGFANWDRLPQKELELTLSTGSCNGATDWEVDPTQTVRTYPASTFIRFDAEFAATTAGFLVELTGGAAPTGQGLPAFVRGILDFQRLQATPGYAGLYARVLVGGSASVLLKTSAAYKWLAVAASGGFRGPPGSSAVDGGNAGDAVRIGFRAGNTVRTHETILGRGGGGGGRGSEAGVGLPDGEVMSTNASFVESTTATAGGKNNVAWGGDGYYGGGSGPNGGGGGGSYVSSSLSSVYTTELTDPEEEGIAATVRVTPLRLKRIPPPVFNIYVWLTTYNILRVVGGRGALLFSA
jgi:hypothetical protein